MEENKDLSEKKETKKNQFLSLKTKIDILNKLKDGVKPIRISNEYGIALSTISRLKKCKTSLHEAMNMYQNNSERRSLRGTFNPKMEMALHKWYLEQKENAVPVTSCMLRLKARELHKTIHENDLEFRASQGWMEKFKKRYGIRLKSSRGERQTTDNIAFDYDDHNNDNGKSNSINDNEDTGHHHISHIEIKSEHEILFEPTFVTVNDIEDDQIMTDKTESTSQEKDFTRVIECVDEVIQWGIANEIESLYLTMLRSLRARIRYQERT